MFSSRCSLIISPPPPPAFSGDTPSDHSQSGVYFASHFSSYPHLVSLAQFPRAGTNGVFDSRLTYRPRLGPRRAELLCFLKKNVFILNLISVFCI